MHFRHLAALFAAVGLGEVSPMPATSLRSEKYPPPRKMTDADRERIEAAKAKRARKAVKRKRDVGGT